MASIAIVGASADRAKYGNRAVRAYQRQGFTVYPIHPRAEAVEGLPAYPSLRDVPADALDRVSLYVPPNVGLGLLEDMLAKPIGEIWLNPGSESAELIEQAQARGLKVIVGCSILDIGEDPGR